MLTHPPRIPHPPPKRPESLFLTATLRMFLLLAGPAPAMAQMPPVTPVCDRTPEVRDEIVRKVPGITDCADVTEAQLATIRGFLSFHGPINGFYTNYPDPIKELKEGDFSGLTSLTSITLSRNELLTLPEGIFSGLTALRSISIVSNQTGSLPEGVFSGLSSLGSLSLRDNKLTTLPERIFSGPSSMIRLYLAGNRLRDLPSGVFSGLSSLHELRLHHNQLRRLPDGIFSGLTSLAWLNLADNPGPLFVPVSLEWVEPGRFRARAPTGAPFDIALAIGLSRGAVMEGDSPRVTIPTGHTESPVQSVSRSPDTTSAVTVEIARIPRRPGPHYGYTLIRSPLPLAVWEAQTLDFAHFANGSPITSELVIVNVGTEPTRPSIRFYDKEGDSIHDQWFTRTDTTDFTGTVRCNTLGGEKFTGVALEMDTGNRIFTTLPILPLRRPLPLF